MRFFKTIIGDLLIKAEKILALNQQQRANELMGGGNRSLLYPFNVVGWDNIRWGDNISIGAGATIFSKRADLIIKGHFIAGPGLTIITGDHMSVIGKFIDEVSDSDKDVLDVEHLCDKDVVIEEDVWVGANVTILKGVTIGRGSIIAAGSVVTKDIPIYSVAGGVPARVIRKRMTEKEINEHELILYK